MMFEQISRFYRSRDRYWRNYRWLFRARCMECTPYDIYLPLTGGPGIECRSGGGTNIYQIVVSFLNNATFKSASVTSGQGMVTTTSGNGTKTITINLSGVTNAQTINITLFNLNDGLGTRDLIITMAVLVGDVSGNGMVNSTDVSQTKSPIRACYYNRELS